MVTTKRKNCGDQIELQRRPEYHDDNPYIVAGITLSKIGVIFTRCSP